METYYLYYPLRNKSSKEVQVYSQSGQMVCTTQRHQKNRLQKVADLLMIGGTLPLLTIITSRDSDGNITNQALPDNKWFTRQTWKLVKPSINGFEMVRDKSVADMGRLKKIEFRDEGVDYELKIKNWKVNIIESASGKLVAELKHMRGFFSNGKYVLNRYENHLCIFTLTTILHIYYTL